MAKAVKKEFEELRIEAGYFERNQIKIPMDYLVDTSLKEVILIRQQVRSR